MIRKKIQIHLDIEPIKATLVEACSRDIVSTKDTLYILVLIRKILEVREENKEVLGTGFPVLKFYCNWALHVRIDFIDAVKDTLNGVAQGYPERVNELYWSTLLLDDLNKFFEAEKIKSFLMNESERAHFLHFVRDLCSETPLVIDRSAEQLESFLITLSKIEKIEGTTNSYMARLTVKNIT